MTTGRPVVLRREPEHPQQATFLELFFDLVFVLVLVQLSRGLSQNLAWSGAFQTLILALALWGVWVHTAELTDAFDPRQQPIQLVVVASMLGSLVLAAVTPQAFRGQGLVFAGGYLAIQLGRTLFVVLVEAGRAARRRYLRQLAWFGASAVPWIAGATTHHSTRAALWTVAVIIDVVGVMLRFPKPRLDRAGSAEFAITGGHLAERYRHFFIIALGELILVTGLALSDSGLGAAHTAALVVSFATTATLWRIYIHRAGELLATAISTSRNPVLVALAMSYAHLTMVAGIVVIAVGQDLAIADPLGRTRPAVATVILGGPALYLAGRALLDYAVFARVSRNRLLGLFALAAAAPLTPRLPPLLTAATAAVVLAAVALADTALAGRSLPDAPSPPSGRRP